MKTDSQKQQILNDLSTGVRVTGLKAIKWYGCMKLSNRISELKNEGHRIYGEWKKVKTRHGKKKVMEYFMKPVKA